MLTDQIKEIFNLHRFVEAQEYIYPVALQELQRGQKRSHWMWYIFPQLKHLGVSYNSKFYGLSGVEEAAAYWQHPILGLRLREVCETILSLPTNDAEDVFWGIDSKKLHSSMTLFDRVAPDDIFARVLDKFFEGQRDMRTIGIIESTKENG